MTKNLPAPLSTIEDLRALQKSINQGVTFVYYGDQKVQYRSLADMERIELRMLKELGLWKAPARPKSCRAVVHL